MEYLRSIGDEKSIKEAYTMYLKNTDCLIVGVGGGQNALDIRDTCPCILGIDISKEKITEAKMKCNFINCEFLVCDAMHLPLRNAVIGSILCKATLHHLTLEIALNEFNRVLRNKQVLILQEPGLLNPIALIGRKFFPTSSHTPKERPFIPRRLKYIVNEKFEEIESQYFYLITPALPILANYIHNISMKKYMNFIRSLYLLEKRLLRTRLKELCWIYLSVWRKCLIENDRARLTFIKHSYKVKGR